MKVKKLFFLSQEGRMITEDAYRVIADELGIDKKYKVELYQGKTLNNTKALLELAERDDTILVSLPNTREISIINFTKELEEVLKMYPEVSSWEFLKDL